MYRGRLLEAEEKIAVGRLLAKQRFRKLHTSEEIRVQAQSEERDLDE